MKSHENAVLTAVEYVIIRRNLNSHKLLPVLTASCSNFFFNTNQCLKRVRVSFIVS